MFFVYIDINGFFFYFQALSSVFVHNFIQFSSTDLETQA